MQILRQQRSVPKTHFSVPIAATLSRAFLSSIDSGSSSSLVVDGFCSSPPTSLRIAESDGNGRDVRTGVPKWLDVAESADGAKEDGFKAKNVEDGSNIVVIMKGRMDRASVKSSNANRSTSARNESGLNSDSLCVTAMTSFQLLIPRVATPRSTSHALRHQQPQKCDTSISDPPSRRKLKTSARTSGIPSNRACKEAARCLIRRDGFTHKAGYRCSCMYFNQKDFTRQR